MGPLSYMWSVVDWNVIMWHVPVFIHHKGYNMYTMVEIIAGLVWHSGIICKIFLMLSKKLIIGLSFNKIYNT